jgi:hypothetical protein
MGSAADWAGLRNVTRTRRTQGSVRALCVRLEGCVVPYWLTTSVAVPTLSAVNVPWATATPMWA